ncbi:MAG: hypothetical protein RLZZ58_1216 [Pseudomonadota bacterium]|jgi:hypothetical protein
MENTSILRTLLGTLAGIIVGFVLLYACQYVGNMFAPAAFDMETEEVLIPLGSTLATFVGWLVGAFGGSWLAARTTRKALTGWVVGGALVGAAVYMALAIGDAWWVLAAGIFIPLIGGGLGTRVAGVE